jgi:hypothetical protein
MAASDYEKSKAESPPLSLERENISLAEAPQQHAVATPGAGHSPTFMGMSGRKLNLAVSTVATTGFLLFGYDRKSCAIVPRIIN